MQFSHNLAAVHNQCVPTL